MLDTNTLSDAVAQSFVAPISSQISDFTLYLTKVQDPSTPLGGKLIASLEGDSGNAPDGDPLSTGVLSVKSIQATGPAFYDIAFSPPVSLIQGSRYWIVLTATYNPSDSALVYWVGSNAKSSNGTSALYRQRVRGIWTQFESVSNWNLFMQGGCASN